MTGNVMKVKLDLWIAAERLHGEPDVTVAQIEGVGQFLDEP